MPCCLRGCRDFADLSAYRAFIADVVSRHNARHRARIDAERELLLPLPEQRTSDYEYERVYVTSSSGFALRKVVLLGPFPPDSGTPCACGCITIGWSCCSAPRS